MRSDLVVAVLFVVIFLYGVYHVARWASSAVATVPL